VKTFALSALIAFTARSALDQTKVHHEEYYVIRDTATKKSASWTRGQRLARRRTRVPIVGLGVFQTRSEAEASMKTMDVCDDDDD
jgi:hypothetical protein